MFIDRKKIEFDFILQRISEVSRSEAGRQKILKTAPSLDIVQIREEYAMISELLHYFESGKALDFTKFEHFLPFLLELRKGVSLTVAELYLIAKAVQIYSRLKEQFSADQFPLISSFFTASMNALPVCSHILRHIREDGFVESSASKELKLIRDRIEESVQRSKSAVLSFFREMKRLNYSADDIVSIRDGFDCVAVKSNYKGNVDGVVIDYSNTGQTAFVVPSDVLKLNSQINCLRAEEAREIRKIIRGYCDQLLKEEEELSLIDHELLRFDLFHAKALYGFHSHCSVPEINEEHRIRVINGRHPIIGDKAVPLNIELGKTFRVLVITGPNAGGKTVVMKTIALFAVMVQSGIPIPASPDSSFCLFHNLFSDIGDEQSIADSISTFSGHIKNLKYITDHVIENDLVILDELGNGTSPAEGEALALSILEFLVHKKCLAVVTTHYDGIKHYANTTEGIENGAMEYDENLLLPLYRLRIGNPGSSRAFDIAERMGLKEELIQRAKAFLDENFVKAEESVRLLEKERRSMEEKKQELEKEISVYQGKLEELDCFVKEYKKSEKDLQKIIHDKKRDFLLEARREFENLVRNVKETAASRESIKSGKEFLEKLDKELNEEKVDEKNLFDSFVVGDSVIERDSNIQGTVIRVEKEKITVQFGVVRMLCKKADLVKVEKEERKIVKSPPKISFVGAEKKREIDLRGCSGEDAVRQVERYVDMAITNDIHQLRIIHGIGAGILRKSLQDFLKSSPYVKKISFEKNGEYKTNFGVTIVEL